MGSFGPNIPSCPITTKQFIQIHSGTLGTHLAAQLIILDRLLLLKMDLGFIKTFFFKLVGRKGPSLLKMDLCAVCVTNHLVKFLH